SLKHALGLRSPTRSEFNGDGHLESVAGQSQWRRCDYRLCKTRLSTTLPLGREVNLSPATLCLIRQHVLAVGAGLHDAHGVSLDAADKRECLLWRSAEPGLELILASQQNGHP